jgi:formate/nitrite transporter FocA (FNT family)
VQTGQPLLGAVLFPVGFCMLYLFGFDLLTGVFVLCPLALIDKRPGVTVKGVLRNWGLVFLGNFGGAFTVAVMMAIDRHQRLLHRAQRWAMPSATSARPHAGLRRNTAPPAC